MWGFARFFIASAALTAPAIGQDGSPPFVVPSLIAEADHPERFVPNGWRLFKLTYGDLNRDGRHDAAILMRATDPSLIEATASEYYPTDDTNPFLLVIAFAEDGGYRRIATHHHLLPYLLAPMHGDDAAEVTISRNVMSLTLGQLRGHEIYRFRWNGRKLAEIGYECSWVSGAEGHAGSLSANYLTHRARVGEGNIQDGEAYRWVKLKPLPLKAIDDVTLGEDHGKQVNGKSLPC